MKTAKDALEAVVLGNASHTQRTVVADLCAGVRERRVQPIYRAGLALLIVFASMPITLTLVLGYLFFHIQMEQWAQESADKPLPVRIRVVEGGRTVLATRLSTRDFPAELGPDERFMIEEMAQRDSTACSAANRFVSPDGVMVRTISGKLFSRDRHVKLEFKVASRRTLIEFDVPCSAPDKTYSGPVPANYR